MSDRRPVEPAALPLEIDVETFARMLGEDAPRVLDVREPWEVEICGFQDAQLVPLGTLAQRIEEVPSDRPVVVVCHSGRRSLRAAEFLRAHGITTASSLAGGVEAWALRIDPTMARY